MPMLERYFGKIPAGPKPVSMTTVEPQQEAEKTVVIHSASQPYYVEGYHRPDYRDPDDSVYDAISSIFSSGRTGRLYRSLVRDQRIAGSAEGGSGYPGIKYPGMFLFEAVPLPGHSPEEMGVAIHKELDKMKTTDVTDEELERYKVASKAGLLRGLSSNEGLASNLALNQTLFGDWKRLFTDLQKVDAVTKADIRRVANKTFVDGNRTTAEIVFQAPAKPAAASAGGAR
jgi:predicted Zn-dependent peptidase